MPVVELLRASLDAVGVGLERAQQEAAAADHAAERIAARAAGSGFSGIAQGLSRVRATIWEVGAKISAVDGQVGEATAALADTRRQPTPREARAVLESLTQQLDGIYSGVGAVMEAIGKAQQLTNVVLQGGLPGPLLARLEAIRNTLLAAGHIARSKEHTTTAVAEVRKTGYLGNGVRVPRSRTTDRQHPCRSTVPAAPQVAPGRQSRFRTGYGSLGTDCLTDRPATRRPRGSCSSATTLSATRCPVPSRTEG